MKRYMVTIAVSCLCSIAASAQQEFIKVDDPANNRLNKTEANSPTRSRGSVGTPKKPAVVWNANTPAPVKTFFPTIQGVDPMIAAGDNFVIVSQDHSFAFYDKNGTQLGSDINATTFFQSVIDKANDNQFDWLDGTPTTVMNNCNTNGGQPYAKRILNEAYDTRVIYEPENKRFIILSACRNAVWRYKNDGTYGSGASAAVCDKYAVRIFVFAISKTEDPRDGFYKWYWTKNNYRDWPRISADKDVLTMAHNGTGPAGVTTPSIYVISIKDMMAGKSSLRYFTYQDNDYPDAVIPVAMYKNSNSKFYDYMMYIRGNGNTTELYYFKKSADMWTNKPELKQTNLDMGVPLDLTWEDRPVYRNGKIYFANRAVATAAVKDKRPDVWGFWLYRLPLSISGTDISFDNSSSLFMKQHYSPTAASGTNYDSYDMPSLSVNEAGTILGAYGRWSKTGTNAFLKPEARYFEHIQGETNHRNSALLKAGESTPQFLQTGWTKNVVDGYYHSYKSDQYLDYTTVVPDPVDSKVFWIAHAYANSGSNYVKMVVGKIKADK